MDRLVFFFFYVWGWGYDVYVFITLIIMCYVDPCVHQDYGNRGTNTNCYQRNLQRVMQAQRVARRNFSSVSKDLIDRLKVGDHTGSRIA